MRSRGITTVVVLMAVIFTATSVFAFDGDRKGFILG